MTEDFDDLSVLARRQRLSDADERELAASMASSADVRLWHRVGAAFDAADTVLPDDHQTSERVLARLLGELPAKKARSRRLTWLLVAAAAVLVASVATGAVLELRARSQRGLSAVSRRPSAVKSLPAPARVVEPLSVPEVASAEPLLAVESVDKAPGVTEPPPASAAGLMSAAGRARRLGHAGQAMAILNNLQARYPGSPEARASDVTLGMLQLKNGSPAGALAHFDRYLQGSPGGALRQDALWGKSQALFAQGNAAAARATLSTLLERYPSSPYASAARAKLGAP
jgi:hypothetical protein